MPPLEYIYIYICLQLLDLSCYHQYWYCVFYYRYNKNTSSVTIECPTGDCVSDVCHHLQIQIVVYTIISDGRNKDQTHHKLVVWNRVLTTSECTPHDFSFCFVLSCSPLDLHPQSKVTSACWHWHRSCAASSGQQKPSSCVWLVYRCGRNLWVSMGLRSAVLCMKIEPRTAFCGMPNSTAIGVDLVDWLQMTTDVGFKPTVHCVTDTIRHLNAT